MPGNTNYFSAESASARYRVAMKITNALDRAFWISEETYAIYRRLPPVTTRVLLESFGETMDRTHQSSVWDAVSVRNVIVATCDAMEGIRR